MSDQVLAIKPKFNIVGTVTPPKAPEPEQEREKADGTEPTL